jgi:hypothetical protein
VFSRDKIVLMVTRNSEQKPKKKVPTCKQCPYCKLYYKVKDYENHVNNWCEKNPNLKTVDEPIMETDDKPIIIRRKVLVEDESIVVKYGNCRWCGKYNKLTRIKGGKCFYCDECKEMLEETQRNLDAAKQTEVIEDEPILE